MELSERLAVNQVKSLNLNNTFVDFVVTNNSIDNGEMVARFLDEDLIININIIDDVFVYKASYMGLTTNFYSKLQIALNEIAYQVVDMDISAGNKVKIVKAFCI